MDRERTQVLVVGAGAAGCLAALRARGAIGGDGCAWLPAADAPEVLVLDGSERVGRKILVSGGGRCNVTNTEVDERDYRTGAAKLVRSVLREFPVESVRHFFERAGLPLVEEPIGKLFPVTQRAKDVLEVLLAELRRAGARLETGVEVLDVRPGAGGDGRFLVECRGRGAIEAEVVIVATGGKSVPKTGSEGFGYELAERLGEPLEPPRPALVPIDLAAGSAFADLAGITCAALLTVTDEDAEPEQVSGRRFVPRARAGGSLLFTHRGLSGPAALDVSEALSDSPGTGKSAVLLGDFWTLVRDGSPFPSLKDQRQVPGSSLGPRRCPRPCSRADFASDVEHAADRGKGVLSWLAERQPRRLVETLLATADFDGRRSLAEVRGRELDRLWRAVVHARLPVTGTDGFRKAEVTAGGVRFEGVDRRTLESRRIPGLRWCGEVLDCTGRLGGFNFQWAWSSGYVAGGGLLSTPSKADRGDAPPPA